MIAAQLITFRDEVHPFGADGHVVATRSRAAISAPLGGGQDVVVDVQVVGRHRLADGVQITAEEGAGSIHEAAVLLAAGTRKPPDPATA
jgi:hypothetical protein